MTTPNLSVGSKVELYRSIFDSPSWPGTITSETKTQWVVTWADRIAEQYKSLLVMLADKDNRIDGLALLEASDLLEIDSRFGVPEDAHKALVEARKHLSANTAPKAELICAR